MNTKLSNMLQQNTDDNRLCEFVVVQNLARFCDSAAFHTVVEWAGSQSPVCQSIQVTDAVLAL